MVETPNIETSGLKVLIVEDNLEIRHLIKMILESKYNFTVLEAENGKEALQITDKEELFLVITDLMMPEMNGIELIKKIRENTITKNIDVIVSTAMDDKDVIVDLIKQDIKDYILKPIRPVQLIIKINEFLRKYQEKKLNLQLPKIESTDNPEQK
jgi:DNA-binding response OmpR family regulator